MKLPLLLINEETVSFLEDIIHYTRVSKLIPHLDNKDH